MHEINGRDSLTMIQSKRQKSMMDMVSIADKRGPPFQHPLPHDADHIEQRDSPNKQNQQGTVGRAVGIDQHERGDGQIVAKKLTACVAHEDPRGVRVESQKTQQSPENGHDQEDEQRLVDLVREVGQPDETDER